MDERTTLTDDELTGGAFSTRAEVADADQDDPDSDSWGGQNVFDVYSKSMGTAMDGTKYSTW